VDDVESLPHLGAETLRERDDAFRDESNLRLQVVRHDAHVAARFRRGSIDAGAEPRFEPRSRRPDRVANLSTDPMLGFADGSADGGEEIVAQTFEGGVIHGHREKVSSPVRALSIVSIPTRPPVSSHRRPVDSELGLRRELRGRIPRRLPEAHTVAACSLARNVASGATLSGSVAVPIAASLGHLPFVSKNARPRGVESIMRVAPLGMIEFAVTPYFASPFAVEYMSPMMPALAAP